MVLGLPLMPPTPKLYDAAVACKSCAAVKFGYFSDNEFMLLYRTHQAGLHNAGENLERWRSALRLTAT